MASTHVVTVQLHVLPNRTANILVLFWLVFNSNRYGYIPSDVSMGQCMTFERTSQPHVMLKLPIVFCSGGQLMLGCMSYFGLNIAMCVLELSLGRRCGVTAFLHLKQYIICPISWAKQEDVREGIHVCRSTISFLLAGNEVTLTLSAIPHTFVHDGVDVSQRRI